MLFTYAAHKNKQSVWVLSICNLITLDAPARPPSRIKYYNIYKENDPLMHSADELL